MFFLKQIKTKINSFEIRGKELLYLSDKSLYIDNVLLKEQDVCCFVRGLKECIVFSSWDSVVYTFTNNKVSLLIEGYSLSEKKYSEDKVIISQRVSRGVFNKFVFDLSTGLIFKKIDSEPSFISSFSEIYTIETTLKSVSLLTGEYEWEVDLGEYGDIIKILGLEEGFLWVLLSKRAEHFRADAVLGIDPTKGQILHRYNSEVLDVNLLAFAEDKKSIIAINYINRASWLMELNLPDLSVKRDVLIQSVQEADIYIRQYVIQDGLMYFTAVQKGGFWPQYLGVLDIATLELLWHKKVIDIEAGFNGPPQVSQDKLYALDTTGNFYIFEKEEAA